MKRLVLFSTICLTLVLATSAMALREVRPNLEDEVPILVEAYQDLFKMETSATKDALLDTVYLFGGWRTADQTRFLTLTPKDGHFPKNYAVPWDEDEWGDPVPAYWCGKFEDAAGEINWQGWDQSFMWSGPDQAERPGIDRRWQPDHKWSVTDDTGLVISGLQSLWVGQYAEDYWGTPEGSPGFGRLWLQEVHWAYPTDGTFLTDDVTVDWEYLLRYDIPDEGWDFLFVEHFDHQVNTWTVVAQYTGALTGPAVYSHNISLTTAQHLGQVELRFRFFSDGGYDDEDGIEPSEVGAAQFDDMTVTVTGPGGVIHTNVENFETLPASQPGEQMTFGEWYVVMPQGVGNYADLYRNLGTHEDVLCQFNASSMVCFVNYGQYAAQGVPARFTQSPFLYGPFGGTMPEYAGGMMPFDTRFGLTWSGVGSPIIPYEDPNGLVEIETLGFYGDIYLNHSLAGTMPWVFFSYSIRSTDSDDPRDIDESYWLNSSFWYGGPALFRFAQGVSTWPVPGATYLQFFVSARQYQRAGSIGSPQPYCDNISLVGWQAPEGPSIGADMVFMAQDRFPVEIDLTDLSYAGNRVKFDRAWDIRPREVAGIDYGDSITVSFSALRTGYRLPDQEDPAEAEYYPRGYFKIKCNPLFDDYRDYDEVPGIANFQRVGDVVSFDVAMIFRVESLPSQTWSLDIDGDLDNSPLPVFFPGDVIHYYIKGHAFGNGTWHETTWPNQNNEGIGPFFGNFDEAPVVGQVGRYPTEFTVRALPSLYLDDQDNLTQPNILWYNAFWIRGGENEWRNGLANAGFRPYGHHAGPPYYDVLDINRPDNLGANHIGGLAGVADIEGYDSILSTFGNLASHVMGNGQFIGSNYPNKANCIELFENWFALGGKKGLFTGDNLAYANDAQGNSLFNTNILGVDFFGRNVRPQIGNNTTPTVKAVVGNSVFEDDLEYVLNGGCPGINTFDHVQAAAGAERLSYFANPAGGDAYAPIAAGVLNTFDTNTVVYIPNDLMYILTPAKNIRADFLVDVLAAFGETDFSNQTTVTPDLVLAVSNYPNPFNPATTIKLSLPRSGDVSLKVYNVRGELVRTLVSGSLEAGVHDIVWDGTNDRGAQAASGIYFYETRTGGEVKVGKMALVK